MGLQVQREVKDEIVHWSSSYGETYCYGVARAKRSLAKLSCLVYANSLILCVTFFSDASGVEVGPSPILDFAKDFSLNGE